MLLKNGTKVKVVRVDDVGTEIFGEICGISSQYPENTFYIVKCDNLKQLRPFYDYDCFCVTDACIEVV